MIFLIYLPSSVEWTSINEDEFENDSKESGKLHLEKLRKQRKEQYYIKKIVSKVNDQLVEWIDFSNEEKSNFKPFKSDLIEK